MITSTRLLAKFTRDLLGLTTEDVQIGRNNINRSDFSALQIIIDDLGTNQLLSKVTKYDGDNEVMRYYQKWRSEMTIDFFGDTANTRAIEFTSKLGTEAAEDLQRDFNMTVYYTNSITDVKLLTGEQYSERLQIAITIEYLTELNENILRIDTLQLELESE